MEYVYQLNLPPLLEVLKKDLIKDINDDSTVILRIKPQDYFNDEILKLKNLNWDRCTCFKKTHTMGPIHIDSVNNTNLIWGINWIHGEPGHMEYWDDWSSLDQKLIFDVAGLPRLDMKPNGPATKIYPTVSNGVYLVNASVPHRANNYSFNVRYAISLRARTSGLDWPQIIDLFSDLIIE